MTTRACLMAGLFLCGALGAAADTLPLKAGMYVPGACSPASIQEPAAIGIFNVTPGETTIALQSDGYLEFCKVGKVLRKGDVHSGVTAMCHESGRLGGPTGPYKFSYSIPDPASFINKGRLYRWCAEHL